MREKRKHDELSTVKSHLNEIIPEEFPDGSYGSPMNFELSQQWDEDQFAISAFAYEDRSFHEGVPRLDPDAHVTHDEQAERGDPQ